MSLVPVPHTPVVDEVLVGGSPSASSFREGRLLPRWLLLNREVDRITSASASMGADHLYWGTR